MTRLAFPLTAVLLIATPALAQQTSTPPVIVAQGQSVVKVAPDQAWVIVAVETRDSKAPEARRLGAAAMTSVQAALKNSGIAADALKTIGFSLNPDYEYVNGRQRMRGFVVSNRVQVRIDDIAKVADVLDAAGALSLPSSSTLTIAGLRFDVKDRDTIERDALRQAVADAMANAKAMAAGAGAALGAISRIDQHGSPQPFEAMPAYRTAARGGGGADVAISTPIEPSEIEVRANVTLTVEIK